jgi:glycosyltransferase involved in cell wall biosynthesis
MVLLLEHLDRMRFTPSLCLLRPDGEFLADVPSDIPVIGLGKRSAADAPLLVARLAGVLRRRRPDVVLAKVDYTNIIAALGQRLSGTATPLLLGEESVQSDALARASHARLRRGALRWAYQQSSVVTAPSPGVVSDLIIELGFEPPAFAVIPNMVDIRGIEGRAGEPVGHAFSDSRLPLLLAMGRLSPEKGQADLLVALELLNRTRPTNLLLTGTGPDRPRLESLAARLGIAGRVAFTGYVSNPYALMRQADVFVSPSHAESFGNVIIEAMAAGVPVVSTRAPWGPETIITDGHDGILAAVRAPADLAARIGALLADPQAAQAMAARATVSVRRYDVTVVVGLYADLFERTADGARGNGGYPSPRAHRS